MRTNTWYVVIKNSTPASLYTGNVDDPCTWDVLQAKPYYSLELARKEAQDLAESSPAGDIITGVSHEDFL